LIFHWPSNQATVSDLATMLDEYRRCERAIAAGRRWISRNCERVLRGKSIVADPLTSNSDSLSGFAEQQ
jgi:hypothetical protein